MKTNSDRRSFLKKIGIGGIGAGVLPATLLQPEEVKAASKKNVNGKAGPQKEGRQYNEAYTAQNLNRLAFPIGGMGGGMFCLEGTGAVSHMSVRNKPDVFNEPGVFGAIAHITLDDDKFPLKAEIKGWSPFIPTDNSGSVLIVCCSASKYFSNRQR